MEAIISLIVIGAVFYILRPFSIFLHEMGHAIPALIFTKPDVSIYIGTFKNNKNSFKVTINRLTINVKYDPLSWLSGYCNYYPYNLSRLQEIIIILSGVIFSLFICSSLLYFTFIYNLHGSLRMLFGILLFSSVIDLIGNLIPQKINIDGIEIDNDGEAILNSLLTNKKKSIPLKILRPKEVLEQDVKNFLAEKYFNLAYTNSKNGNFKESILNYTKAIETNPVNHIFYNNRGYTYLSVNEFEKAILDFNKSINIEPRFAFAYNNRGFAKIMLGNLEKGFDDIIKSLFLDSKNSYALRNLGIYYYKKNKYSDALIQFEKAKMIDENTPLLREYIEKIRTKD